MIATAAALWAMTRVRMVYGVIAIAAIVDVIAYLSIAAALSGCLP